MSYWHFSLTVVLVGFVTGFSIGVFILPIGVSLLALGPLRDWAKVYWPLLMAVVGFVVGYMLFVPLTCTATGGDPGGRGRDRVPQHPRTRAPEHGRRRAAD